jgi:molybdate transport system substrate-binding protein
MKAGKPATIQLIGMALLAISTLTLIRLNNARTPKVQAQGEVLTLYCAAGMSAPVQAVLQEYQKETGRQVNLQFGGSGTLLSGLQIAKTGDLFLAADETYITIAREKGLVAETFPLARLHPVLLVKSGNPLDIHTLSDLARPEVRIALGDPQAAAIGKLSKQLLEKAGLWEAAEKGVRVRGLFRPTVNGLCTDVATGPIDVAIVWDALAHQFTGWNPYRFLRLQIWKAG